MAALAVTRAGSGPPLVLLHALGSSRQAWDPVIPALAGQFDVLAIDLPGFGESGPFPPGIEPSPAALAGAVASFLDDLGIAAPHVAGNSLGGWVALELAQIRPLASLALLSPAGLWRSGTPAYSRISLAGSRWMAAHATGLVVRLARSRLGRVLVLGQTHGRPAGLTPEYASRAIRELATCRGFEATFRATLSRRILSSQVKAPVRLAFGGRDVMLLPRQSRHLDGLPPGVRAEALPRCGHVPMADDPQLVAAFIADSAASAG